MNDEDREILIERQLRVTQIIAAALMSGATLFLAIVLLVPNLGGKMPLGEPILTYISAGAAVLMILVGLVVPDIAARKQVLRLRTTGTLPTYEGPPVPLPQGPAREAYILTAAFQNRLIIRLALLEGATFFALIAHMLERHWLSLVAAVVLLGAMAVNFPTRGKLDQWIGDMENAE